MQKNKIVLIISIIACIAGCVLWFGYNFAPGSYPYAEEYEIKVSESTLIQAINNFKKTNPKYSIPELKDGRNNEVGLDYWYHIYFYYPDEDQTIHTWTRPSGKNRTTFALIGINQGSQLGNWKTIGKDFSSSENEKQKQKFEERILNRLNLPR